MAQKKSKSKLRKLNFVNRDRRIELISETDIEYYRKIKTNRTTKEANAVRLSYI